MNGLVAGLGPGPSGLQLNPTLYGPIRAQVSTRTLEFSQSLDFRRVSAGRGRWCT